MKKVLVAEDEQSLHEIFTDRFTKEGFEVKIAKDGNEFFDILKKFTPDVILLDILMPEKDGYRVLEELKANSQWKNIPVVITTNLDQPEDMAKGRKLGAVEYLVKSSVSLENLLRITKKHSI